MIRVYPDSLLETRMHYSRVRTVRLLTVSQHALGREVCIPACTGQGGVFRGVFLGGVCPGDVCPKRGVCPGGVVSAWGVSAWGWDVCPGEVSARGCLPEEVSGVRGCLPIEGVCPGGCLPRGVSAQGGVCPGRCLQGVWQTLPMWTDFLTHNCENITLPKLHCGR